MTQRARSYDDLDAAVEYANLIADICKLTPRSGSGRGLEQAVFRKLGYEAVMTKRGYSIRPAGESHWQSMPQILTDFGTAIRYTIGHRYGSLDHPLEVNWYIQDMCERTETVSSEGLRIAAWAVRLGKVQKTSHEAIAITPAAALVAAWLRAQQ